MFKLINFILSLEIFTHFDFDGCNTFQKSWDRGNKGLGKLKDAQKKTIWSIPLMNRLIGNRFVS